VCACVRVYIYIERESFQDMPRPRTHAHTTLHTPTLLCTLGHILTMLTCIRHVDVLVQVVANVFLMCCQIVSVQVVANVFLMCS
jgi:hypothetical protein